MKTIDAKDKILGRLATEIADTVRGKDKTNFAPNILIGEDVEIKNADKIKFSGRKIDQKVYYQPSMRPGHLKTISLKKLVTEKKFDQIILRAVKGMLPKNKLQKEFMKKIKFVKDEQNG